MAEGGGLLNRYRVKSSIGGSNPPLSAINLENPYISIYLREASWLCYQQLLPVLQHNP